MAELADRIPGEIIFAAYANDIRDRAAMRYVDAAARDASEPLPDTGEIAYLTTTGEFQIYDGTDWVGYARLDGATFTGGVYDSDPTAPGVSIGFDVQPDGNAFIKYSGADAALHNLVGVVGDADVRYYDGGGVEFMRYVPGNGIETHYKRMDNAGPSGPNLVFNTLAPGTGAPGENAGQATLLFKGAGNAYSGIQAHPSATGGILQVVNGDGIRGDFLNDARYVAVNAGNHSYREIVIGSVVPNNDWGRDGDIYVRYQ